MWVAELTSLSQNEQEQLSLLLQCKEKNDSLRISQSKDFIASTDQKQLVKFLKQSKLLDRVSSINSRHSHPLLSSKKWKNKTEISLGKKILGSKDFIVMAGPCALEDLDELDTLAAGLKACGVSVLRAGCYKPRTSPYSFQGVQQSGFSLLHDLCVRHELLSVSEVVDEESLEEAAEFIDILQLGSRNMFNYALLKKVAAYKKPVLLKRGFCATYNEWLLSAEYLLSSGCNDVILCERGIRTFENHTRFTLDLQAIPVMKELTHLPVIVDPSHACGERRWVASMAQAAMAAGAHGMIVEVHPNPQRALCDGLQSLSPEEFYKLLELLAKMAPILDRNL